MNDARTLFILNKMEQVTRRLAQATEVRERRQQMGRDVKELSENGRIAVIVWSRDCDCAEGTHRRIMPANLDALDEFMSKELYYAEGPTTFTLARPSEPFTAEFRDRALEAYEDGRGKAVVI